MIIKPRNTLKISFNFNVKDYLTFNAFFSRNTEENN